MGNPTFLTRVVLQGYKSIARCQVALEREECRLSTEAYFHVENGDVLATSLPVAPAASSDRLYLVHASGLPELRPLYDSLSNMGFDNLNPDRVRDLQAPDAGEILARDGGNRPDSGGIHPGRHPG